MAEIKPFEIPWTPVHNYVFDQIMPKLSPNGWKVLCVAIRQTIGWAGDRPGERREWDTISYTQFLTKTGIRSDVTLTRAIRECIEAGYLLRRRVHTHPGTLKPIYAYALNTDYTATIENGVAPTIESKVDATIETMVTKQRNTNKESGDGTPKELTQKLIALGVHKGQAEKWVKERPAEMVLGWVEYVRGNGHGLANVPGFLVSKLKANERPPMVERQTEDPKRYLAVGTRYEGMIQH